jgi:predicted transcriptional regulator
MPGQHKHKNPIPFRPPSPERMRLTALAERTGQAVNAILTQALREYLDKHENSEEQT